MSDNAPGAGRLGEDGGFDVAEVIARALLGFDPPTGVHDLVSPTGEQPIRSIGSIDAPAAATTITPAATTQEPTPSPVRPGGTLFPQVGTVPAAPIDQQSAAASDVAPAHRSATVAPSALAADPEAGAVPATGPVREAEAPVGEASTSNHAETADCRSRRRTIIEWVVTVVAAIVVAGLINHFVVTPFRIPSPSMVPTLQEGERLIVNRQAYNFGEIDRGDVVVFDRPAGMAAGEDDPDVLVKRVVGLPGDRVEARDGRVWVNGEQVKEAYLEPGVFTEDFPEVNVPEGRAFVMGDNRKVSLDSRMFGPVPLDSIVGRAFLRVWPLHRIGPI